MRVFLTTLLVVTSLLGGAPWRAPWRVAPVWAQAMAAAPAGMSGGAPVDRYFSTSDGVRLHFIDTGAPSPGAARVSAPVLVFVPGWTMPAWIFRAQIVAFARYYRVVALDPRGQGSSDVPAGGYTYDRRGEDIADLVTRLAPQRVVLVGWSLGVLDSLAYVHMHGDASLAGLVLIDNSVGEDPPPVAGPRRKQPRQKPLPRPAYMAAFVRSMFRRPQPAAYLQQLTEAALRTPEYAAGALLSYAVPRSYWKEAIYATDRPVLYVVRPGLAGQAGNLAAHRPGSETVVVPDLGHAMFVDDPGRFNSLLQSFLSRRVAG